MRRKLSPFAKLVFVSSFATASAFAIECPTDGSPVQLERFRDAAATALSTSPNAVDSTHEDLKRCFADRVPACVQRVQSFVSTRRTFSSSAYDTHARDDARKQPPEEFIDRRVSGGTLVLRNDIENIAKSKNWPVVRYKSRHAGGFDAETPSLMMIRVPGDQLDPPVNYDRYLNFPIPADDAVDDLNPLPQKNLALSPDELERGDHPRQFTIVTVTRPPLDQRSEVLFQKYGRSGSRWVPDSPASVASCYGCHPSGLRAISPLGYHVRKNPDGQTERQLPESEWVKVREMNHAMDVSMNGKLPDWRGVERSGEFRSFLDVAGVGPIVGPTNPLTRITIPREDAPPIEVPLTRQKEFIIGGTLNGVEYPGCYQARQEISVRDIFGRPPGRGNVYRLTREPAVRWQAVRDAMNCGSCHGNVARGALNDRIDFAQIDFKILVDQSMPVGFHQNPMDRGSPNAPVQDRLNPNERIALANCLKVEFQSYERNKTKEWLTEQSCGANSTAARAPDTKSAKRKWWQR